MSTFPAFQFYASDYLSSSKVQRMTLEAEGAYIRLLAYSWQDGFIPADIGQLARMCKTNPRKMAVLWDSYLRDCFKPTADPDKLVNEKLETVRQNLIDFKAKKSEAGSNGAAKRWHEHKQTDGTAIVVPLANDSSSSSISSNTPIVPAGDVYERTESRDKPQMDRFNAWFWEPYPKKVGKIAAWRAWKRLQPDSDLARKISAKVIEARDSDQWKRDNGQYIPNPATWLNQGRWDDELTTMSSQSGYRLA
jgi:uncharacterized protein YdaU (DUF1376 family)